MGVSVGREMNRIFSVDGSLRQDYMGGRSPSVTQQAHWNVARILAQNPRSGALRYVSKKVYVLTHCRHGITLAGLGVLLRPGLSC